MKNIAENYLPPEVDQTLEVLLTPGQRTRLSLLIESSQIFLLTGKWPDDQKRHESIQSILKKNAHLIAQLADTWKKTRNQFAPQNYEDASYLRMYAAYYFSVNVGKLQILLHELARLGQLGKEINAIDIGVGTGSTAVAILDFLYSWGLACELHHQPFPVESFHLRGIDKSQQALDFSAHMLSAYQQALQQRLETLRLNNNETHPSNSLLQKILQWSQEVTWENCDFESRAVLPDPNTNLVVLSNVWNELAPSSAKQRVENLIANIPEGAIAVLLEPGDKEKTIELMKWRAEFLSNNHAFVSIAPCGLNLASTQTNGCSSCWASRREAFHQPALYLAFRKECDKITGDKRSFSEFENKLLSWSYVVLKKNAAQPMQAGNNHRTLVEGSTIDEDLHLRLLGKFYERQGTRQGKKQDFELVDYPLDQDPYQNEDRKWNEYIKVCSLPFEGTQFVVFERSQGFQMPPLEFGQEVVARHLRVERFNGGNGLYRLIPQEDDLTVISPLYQWISKSNGFLSNYDEQAKLVIDELSYRLFGFMGLREFQHEILSRVLCGKSILGIAATGGGKSECYILPAMILPGITVVVSPLRSLMTDQYDQRISQRYGLGDLATYINGDVPFRERQARLKRMELGYYKLVYFTPEQLERGYILDSLRRANENVGIRYLAMDESHCISQWGHDFRPSYLNIVHRLQEYAIHPVIIALTATASPNVREDICVELGLNPLPVDQGGDVFVYSSNRSEINFEVRVRHTTGEKVSDLMDELNKFRLENQNNLSPGAALVFMPYTGGSPENTWRYFPKNPFSQQGRNSAGVTDFASYLERKLNRRVAIYHGKMESEIEEPEETEKGFQKKEKDLGDLSGRTRIREQENFINSIDTNIDIMVATKGFGMGIDKQNIRLVIYRSPTTNMEAYAQEAGRAGRDKETATAILYYSPDAPIDETEEDPGSEKKSSPKTVKSDHQIQEDFLNGRYIRRDDVFVMHAFLHTVQHRLPIKGENDLPDRTYLYFTSDEAIQFFDQCIDLPQLAGLSAPYAWPDFPKREPLSREFGDHTSILNRGHIYENKTKYIDRILAALFRIRPTISGQKNQAYLESVQETGAKVKKGSKYSCNWNAIYHSNNYFGDIFRRYSVTQKEFADAMEAESLLSFAQRINLTLKELAGLLNDIKFFEGRFVYGTWRGSLLNFSFVMAPLWGPAEGKDHLPDWRDYAGAYKRSSKPKENAKRNKRSQPSMDDYFSWSEVSKAVGWEVLPGPAFDHAFPEFLDRFTEMHDEREKNDRASYKRLLTDYIGVREDGGIPYSTGQKECLRSVLLGYLESYEVVVDGKCYSCSNCVPDGNYGKFPRELREKAVTRMNAALIERFKQLKEFRDNVPELDLVDGFFEQLNQEESDGHSVNRYFVGWSGKLLDDNPSHQTAQWLRIEGMFREIIPLQPQEFIHLSQQLAHQVSEPYLNRLIEFLKSQNSSFSGDPAAFQFGAQLSKQLKRYLDEAFFLELLAPLGTKEGKDKSIGYETSSRLASLFSNSGPLSDELMHQKWSIITARNVPSYEEGLKWYQEVTAGWEWGAVENEFIELSEAAISRGIDAALVISWINKDLTQRAAQVLSWLGDRTEVLTTWPSQAQQAILPYCSREMIIGSETVMEAFLAVEEDNEKVLLYGLEFLSTNLSRNPRFLNRITKAIAEKAYQASKVIGQYIKDEGKAREVMQLLLSVVDMGNWKNFLVWQSDLIKLGIEDQRKAKDRVRLMIPSIARSPERVQAIAATQSIILDYCQTEEEIRELLVKEWFPIYLSSVNLLNLLVTDLLKMDNFGEMLLDQLLGALLKNGKVDYLEKINSNALPERWKNAALLVSRLQRFLEIIDLSHNEHKVEYYQLNAFRDLFSWRNNPEQADMLAAALIELRRHLSPGWKTPLQMLVEVLVHNGRASLASELVRFEPDIVIRTEEGKLSANQYIDLHRNKQQVQPISSDFSTISRNVFQQL